MDPKLVFGGLIAVVICALAVRIVVARAARRRLLRGPVNQQALNPDFQRLLRQGEQPASPKAAAAPVKVAPRLFRGPSAANLLATVRRLNASAAQWPEILAAINPRGDSNIGKLLIGLRGPHMFVPHVGLNVIEDGCQRVLAGNPEAALIDALKEAARRSESVTTVRD